MAGNKRQRELERMRRERQELRRVTARRKRRRQQGAIAGVVLAVAAVVTVIALVASGGKSHKTPVAAAASPKPSASASASPSASPSAAPTAAPTTKAPAASTTPACGGTVPPAPKKLTFAKEPPLTIDPKATYVMHLATSCGAIDVTLDAAKAPRTVNTLAFLASKHYFDGTYCHRETAASAGFAVLQCGDPTGTGAGSPGFSLPEENLKGTKYLRGEVAMAKTQQPHSTGSQFFLLDSNAAVLEQPSPTYTLVGKITKGLDVLDHIIRIGQDNSGGSGDGKPLQRVYFTTVTVTRA